MRLPGDPRDVQPTATAPGVRLDPAGVAAAFNGGLGRAGAVLADVGADITARAQLQAERRARVAAGVAGADARATWSANLAEAQAKAPDDPTGFSADFLAKYNEDAKARLDAAPAEQRDFLKVSLDDLGADLKGRAHAFEAVQQVKAQQDNLSRAVAVQANTLRTDASQFDSVWADVQKTVEGSSLADKPAALREAKRQLAISTIQGMNERNTASAAKVLSDGTFDDVLKPTDKNVLVNDNMVEQRRREAEARAAAAEARREAEHRQLLLRIDVNDRLKDEEAARADGRTTGLKMADIRAAYADQPEQVARIQKRLGLLDETAAARKDMLAAPIGEDRAILDKLAPDPNKDDYAGRRGAYDLLSQELARKYQALAKDPAGYALTLSPELAKSRSAAFSDPAKMGDYLKASLAMQGRLGVPAERQSPLSQTDAQALVEKFDAAPDPTSALNVLLPVTTGLGDDALARRAIASLSAAHLPDAAAYALDVARDPARRNQARQLLGELTTKPDKIALSAVDQHAAEKLAQSAYEDGLGQVMLHSYAATGNVAYRTRFFADQKAVENVARLRQGSNAQAGKSAYRDLFGHLATIDDSSLGYVSWDANQAGTDDVRRGLQVLRTQAADTLRADGDALIKDELGAMKDAPAGERIAQEKLRRRQMDDQVRDLAAKGVWVNNGDGFALVVPGTRATLKQTWTMADILAAARSPAAAGSDLPEGWEAGP